MNARIVYADKATYDDTSPVKMYWLCSCGGDGFHCPGDVVHCPLCKQKLVVPEASIDARASVPGLTAGVEPPTTTANKLAAYRDELLASSFDLADVRALVLEAARHPADLSVNRAFVDHAAVPAPISLRIEHHEPGSPEDLAARKRFGLDVGDASETEA